MSSKRVELPGSPLCRFTFADGRRCALPAHPDHHGFCHPHASRHGRSPRRNELTRNLDNLGREDLSESQIFLALENVQRALSNRRVKPDRAAVLTYLAKIMLEAELLADELSFRKGSGQPIEEIRKLLDAPRSPSTPNS